MMLPLVELPSEQERNDDEPQSKDKQVSGFRQCGGFAHLQSLSGTVLIILVVLNLGPAFR